MIRVRPGKYTRAVIEAANGERHHTAWHQSRELLRWAIRHAAEDELGARVVYLLNAYVPESARSHEMHKEPK